jgi:hypothetical protein
MFLQNSFTHILNETIQQIRYDTIIRNHNIGIKEMYRRCVKVYRVKAKMSAKNYELFKLLISRIC